MLRKSWTLLVTILVLVSMVLAGCGSADKATPPTNTTPASADAPKVDKNAVIKEAVVSFYKGLPENNGYIDPKAFADQLKTSKDSFFIADIRRAEDFQKGHIEGATNIYFREIGNNLDKFPKGKQIVIVCYTGQSASQTYTALRLLGYNAIVLKGGFVNGWQKEKLPEVK